jgi:hypothetical protein
MIPVVYVIAKYVTETNYETEKDLVFIPEHEANILHIAKAPVSTESSESNKQFPLASELAATKM